MNRMAPVAGVVLGLSLWLLAAGQPGEKAKGTPFTNDGFTLIFGKLKATEEMDFGDRKKCKHNLELSGSVEVPKDVDVAGVHKKFLIRTLATDKDEMAPKNQGGLTGNQYNGIIDGVGQVELSKTEVPVYSTQIRKLALETDVIIAKKRDECKLPAVVMEEFKDIGHGIKVRITSLQMSASRELTVKLDFKRSEGGTYGPFIEQIFALDPQGKELGGGRWTEGDPIGERGYWMSKFKIAGNQFHQSFRLLTVTECATRKISFEVKGIFAGE